MPHPPAHDPRLAERLIANLLDNAIRYNEPGGWVRIHAGTAAGGLTTLWIANSGPVIPPAEVDRLFGPFQRLTPDRTGGSNGSNGGIANGCNGLGLSIVHAIAVAHKARLWAQTRPEGGLDLQVRFSGDPPEGNEG